MKLELTHENIQHYIDRSKLIIPEGVEEIVSTGGIKTDLFVGIRWIRFPHSLKKIHDYCFYNVPDYEDIWFYEGLESIGNYCFHNVPMATGVKCPHSLKEIGKGCFVHTYPDLFHAQLQNRNTIVKSDFIDYTHFQIEGTTLIQYTGQAPTVMIPDGITTIKENWNDPGWAYGNTPDSVVEIEEKSGFYLSKPKYYLHQARQLDYQHTKKLIEDWGHQVNLYDYIALYLHQEDEDLIKLAMPHLLRDIDQTIDLMGAYIVKDPNEKKIKKALTFIYLHRPEVSQQAITKMAKRLAQLDNKQYLHEFLAHTQIIESSNDEDLERYCLNHFDQAIIHDGIVKMSIDAAIFDHVRKVHSDKTVSRFVVACTIVPYMLESIETFNSGNDEVEDPKWYLSQLIPLSVLKHCDAIAQRLNPDDLERVIDSLFDETLEKPLNFLIPYARFGTNRQIINLITHMNKWQKVKNSSWPRNQERGNRKKCAYALATGALLLTTNRYAIRFIEYRLKDNGELMNEMAQIHHVSVSALRRMAADLGYDQQCCKSLEEGKGETMIRFDAAFHLQFVNQNKQKMTTHNQELLSTLAAEQNELEEVVHYLSHLLKGTYVFENNTFALQEWVTLFIDNPIGKQIAKKLVWEGDHQIRFMIGDHAYVDQRNATIDIQHFQTIAAAYPRHLPKEELTAWQEMFQARHMRFYRHQFQERPITFASAEDFQMYYHNIKIRKATLHQLYLQGWLFEPEEYSEFYFKSCLGFAYEHTLTGYAGIVGEAFYDSWEEIPDDTVMRIGMQKNYFYKEQMTEYYCNLLDRLFIHDLIELDEERVAEHLSLFDDEELASLLSFAKKKDKPVAQKAISKRIEARKRADCI